MGKKILPTSPPMALFSEGSSWLQAWSHNKPAELAAKREKDGKLLGRCLATLGLYGSRGPRDTGGGGHGGKLDLKLRLSSFSIIFSY